MCGQVGAAFDPRLGFFGCGIITLSDTEAVARQSRQDRWFPLALDNYIYNFFISKMPILFPNSDSLGLLTPKPDRRRRGFRGAGLGGASR